MSLAAGRPRPLLNAYSLDGGYWSRRLPTFKDGQMRFLSPQLHQVLDYVTIAAFALSPTLVPLNGVAAIVAYALAVVHLAVTVSTDFPGGSRRPLPLPAHGALEAVVGIALLALPFLAGWTDRSRTFYLVLGAVILVVSLVSRYRTEKRSSVGAAV